MNKSIKAVFITFLFSNLFVALLAQPQTTLKGIVTNETDEPLSSVTIRWNHNLNGILTDNNGKFNIRITNFPDTLLISRVGYITKTFTVTKSTTSLSITLSETDNNLNDVTINTGYQKLSPNKATGSYTVIDNKTLNQQSGTNILQRLKGVTSGLLFNTGKSNPNPNNTTDISIRGLSTINGPLDPLIVVDNFIYDGDINNINPNDVENITILKDAAAASIWGARAGNGVIVITTKKGKFNQKLKLDINANTIIDLKPNLYYLPKISSADYIAFEEDLFKRGYYDADINSRSYSVLSPVVEMLVARRENQTTAADSANLINKLNNVDSRDLYNKYFLRNGVTQQYSVGLRGGSQQISWLFSGNYDRIINNYKAKYHKINLHFENTLHPIKNAILNLGVYYTNSTAVTGESDYASTTSITGTKQVPYLQITTPEGHSTAIPYQYRPGYIDTAGAGNLLDWRKIPLEDWQHKTVSNNIEDLVAHIRFEYRILDGLSLNINYQYERQRKTSSGLSDTSSYYTRNLINLFTQINPETGTVTRIVPIGSILNETQSQLFSQNLRGQINYNQNWANRHKLNLLFGAEIRENGNHSNKNNYYGYNEDPLHYTNVDVVNNYPTYITGNPSGLEGSNGISQTNYRYSSFFSNVSYAYIDKYTLSGSLRKDGSNIFGATTNNKWKPLWSAGLGWEISKESFYNSDRIPFVKLSATWGSSGNIDVSKTPLPVAAAAISNLTSLPFLRINTLNNPGLKWEQAYQFNLRLAFETRRHQLNGTIEYYYKKGTDLYGQTPYDYTAWGYKPTITMNIASMKGNGVDIVLNAQNTIGTINWNTKLLFNYNLSKTTKYYSLFKYPESQAVGGGEVINPIVGKPLYSIYAYKWGGLDNEGNPQGYIANQKSIDYTAIRNNISDKGMEGGSIKYIGSATPNYFGALMNAFMFKGFSLSFNINYKFGYYLFKPTLFYGTLARNGTGGTDYNKRWKNPGDENKTNVPSLTYPMSDERSSFYSRSDINVIKGDHIRLQFVDLSYTIQKMKQKSTIEQLQLYINASNLGIIWRANNIGIDPDYGSTIPVPKSFTIGVKATF
ncbi:MAG TPA: SusC/RagA family TonB-linked outer membrane protein [Arachidicoccus sp.]|nr:SusC/RagA family TonB-linked outer membrane protein [Arachidicoccus sp.]